MPELPEVETTRRGIEPHLVAATITEVIIRRFDLRQPISKSLSGIEGRRVMAVLRRSKYLLLCIEDGSTVIIHLGMSGSLRVIEPAEDWKKHDHVGFTMSHGKQLRFHDPRRFGLVLRTQEADPQRHPLLASLGPEPLQSGFDVMHLLAACSHRKTAIKQVIMDGKVVVGVGNIYASEALFRAKIDPAMPANQISKLRLSKLVEAIRKVLVEAIDEGGTTLRDFLNSEGKPGYFKQRLAVYGRKGEPCRTCKTAVAHLVLGQRSTYFCPKCQKTI